MYVRCYQRARRGRLGKQKQRDELNEVIVIDVNAEIDDDNQIDNVDKVGDLCRQGNWTMFMVDDVDGLMAVNGGEKIG